MSPSDITVIMTSVTALAAIVAPVITAIYSGKTQEQMKRTELYSPRVYDELFRQLMRDITKFLQKSRKKPI